MAIVKGEMQDEFLWDHEYFEPKAGKRVKGGWRSRIEELERTAGRRTPI